MSDEYQCNICGKRYEYRRDWKNHKELCGVSKLTDYDFKEFSGELKRIEAVNKKISKNNDNITDKSEQRNLRNHKVRQQHITSY